MELLKIPPEAGLKCEFVDGKANYQKTLFLPLSYESQKS